MNKVTFFVPSTQNVNEPVDTSAIVNRLAFELTESHGGATVTTAKGYYRTNSGEHVIEDITCVSCYFDAEIYQGAVENDAQYIRRQLNQESVLVD